MAAAVIEFLLGDSTAGEFNCSKHLTGAKKNFLIKFNQTSASNHGKWPFMETILAFWGKFRRPLAALDRCTLNRGAFAFKIVRGDPELAA